MSTVVWMTTPSSCVPIQLGTSLFAASRKVLGKGLPRAVGGTLRDNSLHRLRHLILDYRITDSLAVLTKIGSVYLCRACLGKQHF